MVWLTVSRRFLAVALFACCGVFPVLAQVWQPMGPSGGDVRTLAADPDDARRLFLGTADGHIFGSTDAGDHWAILGRAGSRLDSVVTAIVVDPRDAKSLLAATWTQDPATGGAIYHSADGGQTWSDSGLAGHAIRALAAAPSNPDILVAAAVDGAFRSADAGRTWQRISPQGNQELRNLDSVAIDPKHPDVIYVGTYHLPWKTSDAGKKWTPIHEGMIDDSDVMSIIVDRTNPRRVYASACSGIYLSEDGAAGWRKIQGIPYSARRTQAILQDPASPAIVYAATTEGLWKTSSAGSNWARLTPEDWVISSVLTLPRGSEASRRVVIGTEKLGVLVSDDNGKHFRASNDGFYHRQIVALALDPAQSGRILAVLANAPDPILATQDGGRTWSPLGPGLGTGNLRHVYASPDGWWASLGRGGLVRYDSQHKLWEPAGHLAPDAARTIAAAETRDGSRKARGRNAASPDSAFGLSVTDMAFCRTAWFAATDEGLLRSSDKGVTWSLQPLGPLPTLPVRSVRVSRDGQNLWVVSLRGLVFSHDAGKTWSWHDLPLNSGGALWLDVALASEPGQPETIVAAAENGLYLSPDAGKAWHLVGSGLPQAPIQDLAIEGSTFLASMRNGGLYLSRDRGESWSRVSGTLAEGFFPVVTTEEQATRLFAASATEGLYAVQLATPTHTASRESSRR